MFDDDPIASYRKRQQSSLNGPSVLDDFKGSELDPDPIAAHRVKRERLTPDPDAPEPSFLGTAWDALKGVANAPLFGGDDFAERSQNYLDPEGEHPYLAAFGTGVAEQLRTPLGMGLTTLPFLRGVKGASGVARPAFRALSAIAGGEGVETAADEEQTPGTRVMGGIQALAGGAGTVIPLHGPAEPRPAPNPFGKPRPGTISRELTPADEFEWQQARRGTPPPESPAAGARSVEPPAVPPSAGSAPAQQRVRLGPTELASLRKVYGQKSEEDFRSVVRAVEDELNGGAEAPPVETPLPRTAVDELLDSGAESANAARPELRGRPGEYPSPDTGGVDVQGSDVAGPVGSEAVPPAGPPSELFARFLADARNQGLSPDDLDASDADLWQLFQGREGSARSLVDDLTQINAETNPDELLRAIAQGGGLRRGADVGEVGRLAGPFGRLKDVPGVLRNEGKSLDEMAEFLQQDPRFKHIVDPNTLLNEIDRVVAAKPQRTPTVVDALDAVGVREGTPWWETAREEELANRARGVVREAQTNPAFQEGVEPFQPRGQGRFENENPYDIPEIFDEALEPWDVAGDTRFRQILADAQAADPNVKPLTLWNRYLDGKLGTPRPATSPTLADILPTGEVQPRLPGDVGAVREAAVPTPPVAEAPFALSGEPARGPVAAQPDLIDELMGGYAGPERRQAVGQGPAGTERRIRPTPQLEAPEGATTAERNALARAEQEAGEPVMGAPSTAAAQMMADNPAIVKQAAALRARSAASRMSAPPREAVPDPLDELAQMFEVEGAQREANVLPRRLANTSRVTSRTPYPKTEPTPAELARGQALGAESNAARAEAAIAKGETLTLSERQSRAATVQGLQKGANRRVSEILAKPALDESDVAELGQLYQDEADRFGKAQLKGGTGKALPTGTEKGGLPLGSMFGPLQAIVDDPVKWAKVGGELVRQPAVRSLIGAVGGYATGDDSDESMRNALYGAVLAYGVPTGLRALNAAVRKGFNAKVTIGGATADKDISLLRMLGHPERTVPEVFHSANRGLTELQGLFDAGDLSPMVKNTALAIQKRGVVKNLRDAAKTAKGRGFKRKAYYVERLADSIEGNLTRGQQAVKRGGDVFGLNLRGNEIERHLTGNVYRVLTGYAIDTAAKNLTQPILTLAYVSPKSLLAAYKVARSPAAKALGEAEHLNMREIVDTAEDILGEALQRGETKKLSAWHPQKAIHASDNFNRRVAFLAALAEKGQLDSALRTGRVADDVARQFASGIVRKTQGGIGTTPSALTNNPILRGPVGGSLKPFTKYPTMFIENMVDALNDPTGRGQKFVVGLLGTALAGRALGIDLEDLLLGGGRPLNMSLSHPEDVVRNLATPTRSPFPAVRAAADVAGHVTGEAEHDVFGLNPKTSDLPQLVAGRYPMKAARLGGEVSRDETDPLTALMNMLGMKTREQTTEQAKRDEMYRFKRRSDLARRKAGAMKRRTSPRPAGGDYQRLRKQIPVRERGEFDRRFRE